MKFPRYLGIAALLALSCSGAYAADAPAFDNPDVAPNLTPPSYFDGLYAGVMTGISSARHNNFFTAGQPLRSQAAAVAGWNYMLTPSILAGVEVQAAVDTDFLDASDFDVMGYGRLGFLADDRFMVYLIGGAGYFADAPAWEAGMGAEWMASNKLSLRLEGLGIGQLGNVPNGQNVPGVSAVRLTSGVMWHFDAPDGNFPDTPAAAPTDFTGPYAGLIAGAWDNPSYNFFVDYGHGGHLSRVGFGAVAGWNYGLTDNLRVGGEIQAGTSFDSSGDVGVDGVALARAGYVAFPGLMPYVAGGVGMLESKGVYAVGGGVEYALWGKNTIRAEALELGGLGDASTGAGLSATKLTVGFLWHTN